MGGSVMNNYELGIKNEEFNNILSFVHLRYRSSGGRYNHLPL